MEVKFNVPPELENLFKNKTQQEIDRYLSEICKKGSGLELLQNMCFDILTTVTSIADRPIVIQPNQSIPSHSNTRREVTVKTSTIEQKEVPDITPKTSAKSDTSKGKNGKKRFAKTVLR